MKNLNLLIVLSFFISGFVHSKNIDLFIVAGQSNAQGWTGDAKYYPKDVNQLDKDIPLYWLTPGKGRKYPSSNGKWVSMQAQTGRYKDGHFGLCP